MTTLSEVANTMKIYTEERILCTVCMQNKNFLFVVKQVESKYYLLEMCPRCQKHCEDIKEIPSRIAKDYPAPTK
jgi:superfamily II helicase